MEKLKTQMKGYMEEIMLTAPEVREEAVQLYADLQVCNSWVDLWRLADASEKLVNKIAAAQVATVAGESEAAQ